MARFRLLIEYAGTRYSGWQIQKNARTVQGEIDRAVREAAGRREFELYGAGRTDAGVHALAQVAHLDLYTSLAPEPLRRKINDALPADIHIREIAKAPHKFHARHDAIERSYLYQISTRRTAFGKPFVWWIREPVRLEAMRAAAGAFVGLQNFEAFTADDPDEKSTTVLVDAVEIESHGALLLIRVRGSHFLWKMVRRMVGVLAAVGRGEIAPGEAAALLDPARTAEARATAAALAAPAAGLFLEAVRYAGDPPIGPLRPVLNIERT
jgi:tRNA pseudouridine38-40 synthase